MKTIFKIYIMVVRHCAWQILSSLGAELLVAMLGPIGLQVYEKQVQALEAGALEQLVLFLIIMLTVNIVAIIIENLDGLLTQKMQLEITRNFGKPVFEYIQNVPLYHMSDSNFVADKERAINAVENDILLVVQNINGSIALIVSIIVLSVMVAQYDVLALVVLIIMVIVQNVFTKRGTSEGVELNKSLEMYNIDKPQERRKATGTGGIPPENIRLRRTLTTEYLQLSLCYGVRDRMSIETAGFTGWR